MAIHAKRAIFKSFYVMWEIESNIPAPSYFIEFIKQASHFISFPQLV